ncbi:MAG: hypothetical protein EOM40_07645 [Clostridia bacterium]|nr:hypothetical protein [Clostridia bacterium]
MDVEELFRMSFVVAEGLENFGGSPEAYDRYIDKFLKYDFYKDIKRNLDMKDWKRQRNWLIDMVFWSRILHCLISN